MNTGATMKKTTQLLLSLFTATTILTACGGGGGTTSTPITPTETKNVVPTFVAGQEWKTSVANKTVAILVKDATGAAVNGALVSLYSIAKTDPTDGSAITDPTLWIRKGLLVRGATGTDGVFTATDLLLPDAASAQVLAAAELSTTTGTAPNVTVTGVSNASGVATVGTTTTLTLVNKTAP
jgi:hypothetical protein